MKELDINRRKLGRLLELFARDRVPRHAAHKLDLDVDKVKSLYSDLRREISDNLQKREPPLMLRVHEKDVLKDWAPHRNAPLFAMISLPGGCIHIEEIEAPNLSDDFNPAPRIKPATVLLSCDQRKAHYLELSTYQLRALDGANNVSSEYNHVSLRHREAINKFWQQAKSRIEQYNVTNPKEFALHLKEQVWRHNTPDHSQRLEQLRTWTDFPDLPSNSLGAWMDEPPHIFALSSDFDVWDAQDWLDHYEELTRANHDDEAYDFLDRARDYTSGNPEKTRAILFELCARQYPKEYEAISKSKNSADSARL